MLELLKKFVSQNDPREYMRSPFNRGEWTYATNWHIAVRVPKIDGIATLAEKHIPELEGLFKRTRSDNAFVALPPLPPLEKCLMCNGSGQVEYGSTDVSACWHCGGTGVARYKPVKVGGSHFDLFYLSLIKGLPGAKFAPGAGRMDMARFVFDGGEGILMPMRTGD